MLRIIKPHKNVSIHHSCSLCWLSSHQSLFRKSRSTSLSHNSWANNGVNQVKAAHRAKYPGGPKAIICYNSEHDCVSPCAFKVVLLGFFLASLPWFKVLENEGVCLSAPLRQCGQKLEKYIYLQ